MRILHIITSLEIGGAQRLLSDILPIMAQNHEVTLLVTDDLDNDFSRRVKSAGVRVMTTSGIPQHSLKNILALRRLMKGYDIVHVHLFPMLYWVSLASLLTSVRLVYTEHSTSNRRRGKWSWGLEIAVGIPYVLLLLLVTFLTFFSLHPLVGFGWRLLIIPVTHLCARLVYIVR